MKSDVHYLDIYYWSLYMKLMNVKTFFFLTKNILYWLLSHSNLNDDDSATLLQSRQAAWIYTILLSNTSNAEVRVK